MTKRENETPFLLKLFYRDGDFHKLNDFLSNQIKRDEQILVYTWKDATLLELSQLLACEYEKARTAKLLFRLVYPDFAFGKYKAELLGSVRLTDFEVDKNKLEVEIYSREPRNFSANSAANIALQDTKFVIGDFIDVAIFVENETSSESRRDYKSIKRYRRYS